MKYYTLEELPQKSPEWMRKRAGKLTASDACAIGNNGKGLETLVLDTVADYFAVNDSGEDRIDNKHTRRGNELEPEARAFYTEMTGNKVVEVGFVEADEYSGCSPDGLVGDDGLIEIKCPDNTKFFNHILKGINAIDSIYIWQMQMQLLITGREWVDYVCYNPNFEIKAWIQRIKPDLNMQAKLKLGIASGSEKIKELINQYNQKTGGNK